MGKHQAVARKLYLVLQMSQWVKVPVPNPEDPSLISRPYRVVERTNFLQVDLCPTLAHLGKCRSMHIQAQ